MTTLRRLQTRVPTAQLGRWLLRSGIRLPAPLAGTHLMSVPLDLDLEDLAELTTERIAGSATPSALEGLSAGAASLLAENEDLLRDPAVVVWAVVTERRGAQRTRTVAALVRGARALLLEDAEDECVLQAVAAPEAAGAVAARVAPGRAAAFPPTDVPRAALAAVSVAPSPRSPEADRAMRQAGIDPARLDPVWRVQADVHSFALLGARRPDGGSAHDVMGDVYVGPAGAVLKYETSQDLIRLEPADRATVTRLLVAAATAAS